MVDFSFIVSLYVSDLPNVTISTRTVLCCTYFSFVRFRIIQCNKVRSGTVLYTRTSSATVRVPYCCSYPILYEYGNNESFLTISARKDSL